MAGNSTITLQDVVDDASTLGDVSPALATGGFSTQPALSIANDVVAAMLLGGPAGQPFNWKWNRFNTPSFSTISFQQDYFVPGLVKLGWLEDAWMVNINQTAIPKEKHTLEVHRELEVTDLRSGMPSKICWENNDQLQTGKWGQHPFGPTSTNLQGEVGVVGSSTTGMLNPGANVIYTNPVGAVQTPVNATTCITDPNGNLWALTTYGTCGSVEPSWPTSPAYPTYANQSTVATTVNDGTCVWTAINPKGQGLRLNAVPSQGGVVWQITCVAQMRVPMFMSITQTLEPVPDDYATYFKQGFFAECYRRVPDPKVRAKYPMEKQLWIEALMKAVKQGQREVDDYGFFPGASIMDSSYGMNVIRPDYPYGPPV